MSITRSPGTIVTAGGIPYIVGGGYQGATPELDKMVELAAHALEAHTSLPVEIRFNSDRESGGAFVKMKRGGEIGIGADICAVKPGDCYNRNDGTPRIARFTTYISKSAWTSNDDTNSEFNDWRVHASLKDAVKFVKTNTREIK